MSESIKNNAETHIGDNSDHDQRSGMQASCNLPSNLGEMPPIRSKLANNVGDPNYQPTLVAELMKRIPQVPNETPSKDDKLADRIARCNSKVYDGNYDLVELEEWLRGMEKIFTMVEVPEERKVNIRTYCLNGEVDIQWNTVKGRLVGPEFTWSKFLENLREKFYPFMV